MKSCTSEVFDCGLCIISDCRYGTWHCTLPVRTIDTVYCRRGSDKSIDVILKDRVPSGIYIVVCGLMAGTQLSCACRACVISSKAASGTFNIVACLRVPCTCAIEPYLQCSYVFLQFFYNRFRLVTIEGRLRVFAFVPYSKY
jgi:hypothetical protein